MAQPQRNQNKRRPQIFDEAREPPGQGTRWADDVGADSDGWVRSFVERLAAAIRRIGGKD
jgi:hypothetical protein